MDVVDKISRFEAGEMVDPDEVTEFFQHLIDTGMAWQLQGTYGRAAEMLIEQEVCHA